MTIMDIRSRVPAAFTHRFYDIRRWKEDWLDEQFATKERVHLQWYLIRKDTITRRSLTSKEEVPRTSEMVNAMVLYWLATGERLFLARDAQCADHWSFADICHTRVRTNAGLVVDIASFVEEPGDLNPSVGVASMLKPDKALQ